VIEPLARDLTSPGYVAKALYLAVALAAAATFACAPLKRAAVTHPPESPKAMMTVPSPESARAIEALVNKVETRVAALRGLPSKSPVQYKPLGPDELRRVLNKAMDEQLPPEMLPSVEFVLRRLGLLGREQDLRKILMGLYSEQVAGLYDEETARLFVVTSFNLKTALAELVLAHEICHALQDQNYNLSKWPLKKKDNDDEAYAALSALEGDAMLVMNEYAVRYVSPGRMLLDLPSMIYMMAGQQNLNSAPYFLQQEMIFPYAQGGNFLATAIARDKREEVFQRRPRSTEQILHPDKYFAETPDEPLAVSLKPFDKTAPWRWGRLCANTMGEMGIRIFLEANGVPNARKAAEGWGGDSYALYAPKRSEPRKDAYAFVWKTRWDTETDAAEFAQAMERVVTERLFEGATITKDEAILCCKANDAIALLAQNKKDVIYVDAASDDLARQMLAAAEKQQAAGSRRREGRSEGQGVISNEQ